MINDGSNREMMMGGARGLSRSDLERQKCLGDINLSVWMVIWLYATIVRMIWTESGDVTFHTENTKVTFVHN